MSHGQRTTYVKGCRCTECRAANARYGKLAKFRQQTGRKMLIDAAPVKAHLAKLRAAGVGKRTIAKRAGVSQTVVDRLLGINTDKPANRVRPETAKRLLGVRPHQLADGCYVDATGTIRRLQALVAIGHSQTSLAARIDWTVANLNTVILGRRDFVTVGTVQLIAQLFDELSMQPGSSKRARTTAAKYGWVSPLAWDDDSIDDPKIGPWLEALRKPTKRTSRASAEIAEDFTDLRAAGCTFAGAAMQLGMTEGALEQALHRARRNGHHIPSFNKENAA